MLVIFNTPSQDCMQDPLSPMWTCRLSNWSFANYLIRTSAFMPVIKQNIWMITFSIRLSCKWYLVPMFLVCAFIISLCDSLMQILLSSIDCTDIPSSIPKSFSEFCNQYKLLHVAAAAMNSDSVEDSIIAPCLWLAHKTGPSLYMNRNPVADL